MSGTIRRFAQVQYLDPDRNLNKTLLQVPLQLVDRTTKLMSEGVMSVPIDVAGTAIPVSGVTTPGYAQFLNLSNADFVEIGFQVSSVFYPALKISPGSYCDVELAPGQTWMARGLVNAVDLQFSILQRNP